MQLKVVWLLFLQFVRESTPHAWEPGICQEERVDRAVPERDPGIAPEGGPPQVEVHDYQDPELGKAIHGGDATALVA